MILRKLIQVVRVIQLSWVAGCGAPRSRVLASRDACVSNILAIHDSIYSYVGSGHRYPHRLSQISESVPNLAIFVCPDTGAIPGTATEVDLWTDYIYLGNQEDTPDQDVPLLICPPENHGGHFGHVLWRGRNVQQVRASEIHELIRDPFARCRGVQLRWVAEWRKMIRINVPTRLRPYYGVD